MPKILVKYLRSKKIHITSLDYILPMGGVYGPITHTFRENIRMIKKLIDEGYTVIEDTPDGKKIKLTKENYRKRNGGIYDPYDEDIEMYEIDEDALEEQPGSGTSTGGQPPQPPEEHNPPQPPPSTGGGGTEPSQPQDPPPPSDPIPKPEDPSTPPGTGTEPPQPPSPPEEHNPPQPPPSTGGGGTSEPSQPPQPPPSPQPPAKPKGVYMKSEWDALYYPELTRTTLKYTPGKEYKVGDQAILETPFFGSKLINIVICKEQHIAPASIDRTKWREPKDDLEARLPYFGGEPPKPAKITVPTFKPLQNFNLNDLTSYYNKRLKAWVVYKAIVEHPARGGINDQGIRFENEWVIVEVYNPDGKLSPTN